MTVWLDRVPLRDSSLRPEEILMSESQERMCAVVEPAKLDAFLEICAKWDVLATVIGEVDGSGRLTVQWHGETIVDVPPRTVAHEGPVYERPFARPAWQDALQADAGDGPARPVSGDELRATLLDLVASPNLASKSWVTDQYDRYVLGNTVLAQPEDAGVLRIDDATGLGVAIATDANGRFAKLDPYAGAQLALSEAYRNVAVSGARPLAVTDCLNFGSPEDPDVMWQFAEATRGLADACLELGVPVTGGNVSFYNQTGDVAINPTPVVGVLGVVDDVRRRVAMGFTAPGEVVLLLGTTRDELGGSEWAHHVHGHLGGLPPAVDLAAEKALGALMVAAAAEGLVSAAHDVSDGGLAQTLVEMVLRRGVGAEVSLDPVGADPFVALFSESVARAVVAVPAEGADAFEARASAYGVPVVRLGTTGGESLAVQGTLAVDIDELRTAHDGTLPALFG
jgi:phosphoribosylformylglycinamidine synthase